LERRIRRLESEIIARGEYSERSRFIDRELEDLREWEEKHEGGHTWLSRLLAGTALSLAATIVVLIITILTRGPTP
jgi:hypothetical protein